MSYNNYIERALGLSSGSAPFGVALRINYVIRKNPITAQS
jgi:hypothetical protein